MRAPWSGVGYARYVLGTGAAWVFPQPLFPHMLAGFLDPALGLIVILPGPVRTAVNLGVCSPKVTSVLPKQPPWQAWCPTGGTRALLTRLFTGLIAHCTYQLCTPVSVLTGRSPGLIGWYIFRIILLVFHRRCFVFVNLMRETSQNSQLWGSLGSSRLPGFRPALWKCCASCVLCDHVCASWDVGVCTQVPWCLSQGPVSVSPV